MAPSQEAMLETRWKPLRNLDDILEIERVPFDQRVSASTTYDLFRSAADRFADRPALTTLPKGTPFSCTPSKPRMIVSSLPSVPANMPFISLKSVTVSARPSL